MEESKLKIGIIAPTSICEMPYLDIYIDLLKGENIQYDIINWDKIDGKEYKADNKFTYVNLMSNNSGILKKAVNYIKYQLYVAKLLRKNSYQGLIILCPQTVFFIYKFIVSRFKNKYILDIRDYSVINNLKNISNNIITNSYFTAISSDGYKQWLPKYDGYKVCHNCRENFPKLGDMISLDKDNIVVGTIGSIRDYEGNKKVIEGLCKSNNYIVNFYGSGVDEKKLINFKEENDISNCNFYGRYSKEVEEDIYKKVDLINVYTENLSNPGYVTALPNRLYNGCLYRKPLIARKGTFLGDIVTENYLGIAIDLNSESLEEKLNEYILNFDKDRYLVSTDKFMQKVAENQIEFKSKFISFIKDIEP